MPPLKPLPPIAPLRNPPVCPLLTLGVVKPPSALVPTAQQTVTTIPCIGSQCAWFHAANACSVLVVADAALAQAHIMAGDVVTEADPTADETADGDASKQ